MKSMKFYIYVSNIAVLIFSVMFVVYGCMSGLGIVLGIYGSLRLYRMLKALKSQETE